MCIDVFCDEEMDENEDEEAREEAISVWPSLYSGCLYLWLPIYHTVMDTFFEMRDPFLS